MIEHKYQLGELVEVRDASSNKWREAYVSQLKPYRGKSGYYVTYHPLPKYDPANGVFHSPSTGGWTYEACMRHKREIGFGGAPDYPPSELGP
jgi:hypothetical protein